VSLLDDLYQTLRTNPGVRGHVGDRIYEVLVRQEVPTPALAYHKVGGGPIRSLDGNSGLLNERVQVSCWAEQAAEARALAVAVREALDAAGEFKAVFIDEIQTFDDDTRRIGVIAQFSLWQQQE
jgi:hypothetical protein